MKIQKILLTMLCVALAAACLCACATDNSVEGRMKAIEQSIKDVRRYTAELTINDVSADKTTTVYSYKAEYAKADDGFDATVTEGEFSRNFAFEKTTSSRKVATIVVPVAVAEENIVGYSYKDGKFTCLVNADKLAEVLKLSQGAPVGNATLTCVFDKDKAQTITCNFQTTDGKDVTYAYAFEY